MTCSLALGRFDWIDLTVADAGHGQDFYARVTGWQATPVDMSDHSGYDTQTDGETIAGVCYALDEVAGLPPQWLIYVNVVDLDAAIAELTALGRSAIAGPRGEKPDMRFVVARDPAGASFAFLELDESS